MATKKKAVKGVWLIEELYTPPGEEVWKYCHTNANPSFTKREAVEKMNKAGMTSTYFRVRKYIPATS